jgi:hypothetical protein
MVIFATLLAKIFEIVPKNHQKTVKTTMVQPRKVAKQIGITRCLSLSSEIKPGG